MIKLKDILTEAKQVGIIYHYTGLQSLFEIMEENYLQSGTFEKDNSISFTRDKHFGDRYRVGIKTDVRIVFDGNKLSNKYKFSPYQFTGAEKIKLGMEDDDLEWEQSIGDEQEERLYLPKNSSGVDKVSNYIVKIEFPKKWDSLKFVLSKITPFQTEGWSTKKLYLGLNSIFKKCVDKKAFEDFAATPSKRPAMKWWGKQEWGVKDLVRLCFEDELFDQSKIKAAYPKLEQELSAYFKVPVTFTMES